jgi:hypothetical protein
MLLDLFHLRLLSITSIALFAIGCEAKAAPARIPSDLSNPKPAALTFLTAIAKGDIKTAKAASIGTNRDKEWIDAIVTLITGLREYDSALLLRFRNEAVSADIDIQAAIQGVAEEPIMRLQDGIVKESPDTAEVEPAFKGVRLRSRSPIFLRREKGIWKVDLEALREDPQHSPEATQQYLAAGQALRRLAKDIRLGRYKTFAAAQQASADPSFGR